MNYHDKYAEYKTACDCVLHEKLDNIENTRGVNKTLAEAMRYSVFAGGKRIRPALFFACLDALGKKYEEYGDFAAALECIHTYSLVHDDLPAMDNDDYRRGKLTCHKVFGEAFAVLCGDALLNYALELCLNGIRDEGTLKAARIISEYAGVGGMITGQSDDIENENAIACEENLLKIDANKTGKLLTAPLLAASLICGGKYYCELSELGATFGTMFQYSDDILDVSGNFNDMGKTLGKDQKSGKLTAVSVYGTEGAKRRVFDLYERCRAIVDVLPNFGFFGGFIDDMKNRAR